MNRNLVRCVLIMSCFAASVLLVFAETTDSVSTPNETVSQPITVNGDTVEYLSSSNEITAKGNVSVLYKGSTLTCDKLTVNTQSKDGLAEGDARLDDPQGVIEGEQIQYNFQKKTGTIINPQFRSNPYFGRASRMDKVSDAEFIAEHGYMSTCSYDKPHYRIKSSRIKFFPGDKVQTQNNVMFIGDIPILYLPRYSHSLKDPAMHVQVMPGKNKDWGMYLLTAWRYNLTDNISGRVYLDYRAKLGLAEGFGANYKSEDFGKGDFKYYYTYERPDNLPQEQKGEFQRYLIRWRHQWDIDKRTSLLAEYYKIADAKRAHLGSQHNLLKDYFFREYEKDSQPLSYALLHHNFNYSSVDLLMQKRVNRWYGGSTYGVEKLPEIKYSLPSRQIGESPFYLEDASSYVNYNLKNATPSDSSSDRTYNEFSTLNKFSLPAKLSIFHLTPFVSGQQVYNDKGTYGSTLQAIFSGGTELGTKFYRLYDTESNFLGMDINGLRHIVTPLVTYTYTSTTTMPSSSASFGGASSSGVSVIEMELTNKLQTKRKDVKVDFAQLKVDTSYLLNPEAGDRKGSAFSNFVIDLELMPYSWMRIDADTTYTRSGLDDNEANPQYKHFSSVNYDINFDLGKSRSLGIGQRYQRKGSNEITASFDWRFSPKWRFAVYQRYNFKETPTIKKGLREQQYTFSRDLHCWIMDFTYSIKQDEGHAIWMAFRIKAFPEMEFGFNQSYHAPKSGASQ